MAPNSENAMARFLLAILNQKNLKDIDWNQVASDPVLIEPITNGHAARMRFARFKTTVLGTQPQKRTRPVDPTDKSRVTKARKTQQPKKNSIVNSESSSSVSSYAQVRQSPIIKQEQNQHAYMAQFSPASTSSPFLNDNLDDFGCSSRFLTPCSDDMQQGLSINPASLEDTRQRNGFGPSMDCPPDFMAQPAIHDFMTMGQSHFHTFDAACNETSYNSVLGDAQSPVALDLNGAPPMQDCGSDWPDHFNDTSF
ncbi:hypothetical protein FPHYL_8779 [Fusarium phyllophilum]|uniref:Myb-like DNA-binding domain-containing protein n=1 Tax=Fusarium phyllophilum TaxID=47803 RepID=A0A8H5N5F0_9HYPO|nr:hypothetical protein FPHYL_8779 [Fusarium phyllophilum]